MAELANLAERRTSTDVVYDYLYDEIVAVHLRPGDKISEAEIANRFGISRQPVRDAFSRLENNGLLLVRPQKATEVKRFSETTIARARFVRAAIEVEVLRRAASVWDGTMRAAFEDNLDRQRKVVEKSDPDAFHKLDFAFHRLLCRAAGADFAFDAIAENKMHVDRLCVLSLLDQDAMAILLEDHRDIVSCLDNDNSAGAIETMRRHLTRLDKTIETVRGAHGEYFEE